MMNNTGNFPDHNQDHSEFDAERGSGLYIDVENLYPDGQVVIDRLIDNWPDGPPSPSRLTLYTRADQVELWRLWAKDRFADIEVIAHGTQHFSMSATKNSADIAIATNAMADLTMGRVAYVVVLSDDSDFISLFVAIRDEPRIPRFEGRTPFLWVVTDRKTSLSATVEQFFPPSYLHVVSVGRGRFIRPAAGAPLTPATLPQAARAALPQPVASNTQPAPPAPPQMMSPAPPQPAAAPTQPAPPTPPQILSPALPQPAATPTQPAPPTPPQIMSPAPSQAALTSTQPTATAPPVPAAPAPPQPVAPALTQPVTPAPPQPAPTAPSEGRSPVPDELWEEMAGAVLEEVPVGVFRSRDCQDVIKKRWPSHPMAKAHFASFGTHFKDRIWPILERRGAKIRNPGKKPIQYEMTAEAKEASVASTP